MEVNDPRELVKVWSKIRPSQPPVTEGLQALAAAALTAATLYGSLAKQLSGSQRDLALQLREQQLMAVRCLKGIHRMAGGAPLQLGNGMPVIQTTEAALRKNYGHSLKALRFFESRSGDGEYGAVFETLALREREQLRKLTELMGILQD